MLLDYQEVMQAGNFAHLGGIFWGWLYMYNLKSGRDITAGFNKITDRLFSRSQRKNRLKIKYYQTNPDYEYNRKKTIQQEEVNRILDKIAKSGYESLTAEEKDTLFKMGGKTGN